MMTQERKDQLYDEMFGWICEQVHDSYDLYVTLHEHFGMSKAELHDHCIESLDEYFPEESVRTRYEQKIKDCLSQHEKEWQKLTPKALIEQAETIASFQLMARRSVQFASEEEMAYLLRFKDPLEVLADSWSDRQGMDNAEDESVKHILWEIADQRDAEGDYEMEPEYYATAPDLSM